MFNDRTIAQQYTRQYEKKTIKYAMKYKAVLLKRTTRKLKLLRWQLTREASKNNLMS